MISGQTPGAEQGTQGAKRQTWQRGNPREVLIRICRENRGSSFDELANLHWEAISDSMTLLRTIHEYWFANNYKALQSEQLRKKQSNGGGSSSGGGAGLGGRMADEFNKLVERRAVVRLLTWVQPNGKPLRDCTKEELAYFGGFQLRVSEALSPGETVAAAGLSEAALRKLFAGGG